MVMQHDSHLWSYYAEIIWRRLLPKHMREALRRGW